jgi:biotin carboxyl carrier protein
MINEFVYKDEIIEALSESKAAGIESSVNGNKYSISAMGSGRFLVEANGIRKSVCCIIKNNKSYIEIDGIHLELIIPSEDGANAGGAAGAVGEKDKIYAPMPGKIVKLLVNEGDTVAQKQPMVIVEAMKMENQVNSPSDGKVKKINFADGDQVDTNRPIIELEIE